MVRIGLCVFGRKYTEVNFIFISSYQSGFILDVKLDHLAVVVFWVFFTVKLFSFPPSLFIPNFLIVHRYYLSNCDLEDNILTRIHNFLPTYPPNKCARYIDALINKILKLHYVRYNAGNIEKCGDKMIKHTDTQTHTHIFLKTYLSLNQI